MRDSYRDELNATTELIVTVAGLVRTAVQDATTALAVSYTHLTLPTIYSV